MKGLSFFLLKNSLAAKMKKGLRNFCNGVGSTSTLNQQTLGGSGGGGGDGDMSCMVAPSLFGSYFEDSNMEESPPTLEEMILQLDLEEEAARKARLRDDPGDLRRRMSCVSNSDILRSARNALSQYPRFSLDGKDSMYRSSFRNCTPRAVSNLGGPKSMCCELDAGRNRRLPRTLGGESVVWRKPGIVPKLMGLEAMPVPIRTRHSNERILMNSNIRKQNLRRVGRHELEKRMLVYGGTGRESMVSSSSEAN